MCGRYVNVAESADLIAEFDVEVAQDSDPGPSWNIAPTDPVRIILQRATATGSAAVRQLRTARWGLVPSWSKDHKGAARMINARIETVTDRPAFKTAAARRRCLVPASGYYEWQRHKGKKIPHFLHGEDDGLLAMAGLYELWPDPTFDREDPARWLQTCTIITRQASDLLGEIHDRMPVVVPTTLRASWLDCSDDDAGTARQLLDEMPPARLQPRIVSGAVGNVANNGPELIEAVGPEPDEPPTLL